MSVFELDAQGARSVQQDAIANGVDITADVPPTFFEGTGSGIGQGIMRGGAKVGQFIGMAAAAPVVLYDKAAGTEHADSMFSFLDDTVNNAVDYWTPDANSVGTAGRVLGGLSEIALPLMAGAGNPALMIGSQEMGTATDLVRQGANANAATLVGVTQGLSTAIGFKLPFLGSAFLQKAASGAAGNLATNTAASAASQKLLSGSLGTPEQREQFDPFDYEARLTDVLTGIAFGAVAHLGDRPPSVRDAATVAANAKHFQQDTAPGIPVDHASSVAHQDAMESAVNSLLKGEPVSVAPESAQFLKRPSIDSAPELKADLVEYDSDPTVELPALNEATVPFEPSEVSSKVETKEVDPIVTSAREVAKLVDHQIPIQDEAGNVSTIGARDLLARSDEAVKQAENDSKGFLAAATCFLQVGQ